MKYVNMKVLSVFKTLGGNIQLLKTNKTKQSLDLHIMRITFKEMSY